jgi:integrase/recombinase XerD
MQTVGLPPSEKRERVPQITEIRSLSEQFMSELRFARRLSSSTLRGYRQTIGLLFASMPALTVTQLTPQTMTEFFRRLDARPRWGREGPIRGVRSSTVATYRSKLNRFSQWLVRTGALKVNPFDHMEYPRVEYEDRKYLEKRSIEKIFATTAVGVPWRDSLLRRRNLAIIATLLYAGLRKGELLGLYAIDYSPNHLELRVRGETSKSKRQRVVPVNGALAIALEDYLDERRRCGLQCEKLFVSTRGDQPLTAEGLLHLVKQVRRLSGVAFHLHQFRHTFAVNFLNRGGDVAKLKQLLGHRDIRMTSAYLRCLPTDAMRGDVENITLDTLL